jgi:TonB family protein
VTGETIVVRYFTCTSFVLFSMRQASKYFLQDSDEDRNTAVCSTLLTLLFGWWGFPHGIIFTPIYLVKNLTGGEKSTVNELIELIQNPAAAKMKRDSFSYAPMKVFAVGVLLLIAAASLYSFMYHSEKSKTAGGETQFTKPSAGAPGRGNTQAMDPEVGAYMQSVQRRLKGHWFPPKGNETKRVIVTFRLDGPGYVHDLQIEQSSDDEKCDAAALEAVREANPLPPLPKSLKGTAMIEFTFDYNVFDRNRSVPRGHSRAPADSSQ